MKFWIWRTLDSRRGSNTFQEIVMIARLIHVAESSPAVILLKEIFGKGVWEGWSGISSICTAQDGQRLEVGHLAVYVVQC